MVKSKRVLTAAAFAGVCTLGLFATASLAAGPIMLGGPVSATVSVPRVLATSTATINLETKALSAYRQLRTFWLSRAIVR
jgi:hypothetical protein